MFNLTHNEHYLTTWMPKVKGKIVGAGLLLPGTTFGKAERLDCPKTPRATERHTAPLRPACRSIPAAKFRHSAELNGATRAALNSPPNALRTQRRFRRKRTGAQMTR